MKKRDVFVTFVGADNGQRKTRLWVVFSEHDAVLGNVHFYPQWCCYAFFPASDTLFERWCLRDIADFCENRTIEWRSEVRARSTKVADGEVQTAPAVVR